MEIRNSLTLAEVKEIVKSVVDGVIIDGEYYPEYKAVLEDLYTVIYACPDYFNDKEVLVDKFFVAEQTDNATMDIVEAIHKSEYFNIIGIAVNEKLEFELDKLKNPLNVSLATLIDNLNKSVEKTGNFLTPENIEVLKPALANIAKMSNVDEKAIVEELVKVYKTEKKPTKKTKSGN